GSGGGAEELGPPFLLDHHLGGKETPGRDGDFLLTEDPAAGGANISAVARLIADLDPSEPAVRTRLEVEEIRRVDRHALRHEVAAGPVHDVAARAAVDREHVD